MILYTERLLRVEDKIVYLKSESNYSWVFLSDGTKYLTSYPLSWWGIMFQGTSWYRIHRSYLVNLAYLEGKVWDTKSDGVKLSLQFGDTTLPVSRRRVSGLVRLNSTATKSVSLNP